MPRNARRNQIIVSIRGAVVDVRDVGMGPGRTGSEPVVVCSREHYSVAMVFRLDVGKARCGGCSTCC